MLTEIALALAGALAAAALLRRLGAPGLVGMLLCGVALGPEGLDWLSTQTRHLFTQFKTVALIIILLRAGLGIDRETLRTIGGPALRMGVIPGVVEGTTVALASCWLLDLAPYSAGMLGFIVAAVSPAVVVPQMLELKARRLGETRQVPTLILAGASLDDVLAITLFGVFAGLAGGESANWFALAVSVPTGVALGALLGIALGWVLVFALKIWPTRDTVRALVVVIAAVFFHQASSAKPVQQHVHIASLLGIMALGYILLDRNTDLAKRIARKLNKAWVVAELLLFVAIGTEVQLSQLSAAMLATGLLVLLLGLTLRSLGVALALTGSSLTRSERLFAGIAYWPKATVQAAMGAVPLTLIAEGKLGDVSQSTGQTILAISVLSIVVTAPLGAVAIRQAGPRLLSEG